MSGAAEINKVGEEAVSAVAPVVSVNRLQSLDFIRGIAVMGILVANIIAFGQPFTATLYPPASLAHQASFDHWAWIGQSVLIDGKMRGLFALLFGAGVALFTDKATARGVGVGLQIRRLLILGLIGLFHFYFIWMGDILFLYSVSGLVLLLFLGMQARDLISLGAIFYLVGIIVSATDQLAPHLVMEQGLDGVSLYGSGARAVLVEWKAANLAHGTLDGALIEMGNYGAYLAHVFPEHWSEPFDTLYLTLPETVGLMMIGMGLFRARVFAETGVPRRCLNWGWVGVVVGTLLSLWAALYAAQFGPSYYSAHALHFAIAPPLRLPVIIGLAVLLADFSHRANGHMAERVRAAGRAAFTNYLGTSVVMLFLFHGWALGLFGVLGRAELYLLAVAMWMLMLLWSPWWLSRYRYGPLEWLWRCLTYGKLFPLRR